MSHLLSNFETWITALVDEKAVFSPVDRARHAAFIAVRLATSLVALASVPPFLAFSGAPAPWEICAFGFLMLPLAAVAHLSRTGEIMGAQIICLVALVGLSLTIVIGSGGLSAGALAWLVLAPFEAVFAMSPIMAILSGGAALLAVLSVAALDAFGVIADAGHSAVLTTAIFVLPAVAHATALAYTGLRLLRLDSDQERRTASRYRNLAKAVGDLVLHYDRRGAVLFASRESETLFGLSPSELTGRGFFERIHVGDRPAFLKTIAEAAHAAETLTVTLRLRRSPPAHGEGGFDEPLFVWIEMRARSQTGTGCAEDHEGAVVAVVRDITHSKLREEEIEQARLEALQASVWKDRFLANVSHELRTPLNAIIGFSELLGNADLRPSDPEKQREYAEIIHVSGQHLLSMVNSFLDMSKIEAGSFEILPEPFELAPLIDNCCDMMSLKTIEAGVELVRIYPGKIDELIADKRAVKQILINLLSNAIKFTPARGNITVGVRSQGNSLAIYVADTGIGILPRDLPRLGDPFFQAHDSYDRPYEGTGLGLSIVRGLVGLHGGRMTIESAPGEGTCVTVLLPLDCRRLAAQRGQNVKIEVIARRTAGRSFDEPHEPMVKKIA